MENTINLKPTNKLSSILIFLCRIFVGVIFCYSGFVKAVDPTGLSYKIGDYFIYVFNMPWMVDYTMPMAIILPALELTAGIMLIFHLRVKIAAWILLFLMIVFTPITFYIAFYDAVQDCGCFGDAIKLTNWQTFWKDVILLALAIFIFTTRKRLENPLSDNVERAIAVVFFCLVIGFEHFTLRHLPIIDYRPYKIGNYIPELMEFPPDAPREVIEHIFIMKNTETGEEKEFTMDNYPEAPWTFVDRKDKVIEKGYIPPIHDFTMIVPGDETNYDYAPMILEEEKPIYFVVMHKLEKADEDGLLMLKDIENYAKRKGCNVAALTSSNLDAINQIKDKYQTSIQFFNSDDITLKTIVRANPGIFLLEKGTIKDKWNYRDFNMDN
ncbi:MAG: DoxX family protein [Bacteroidales bacterium]|nr:DoxX family protein [Bacteroidales bacterium]